ncbi:DUF4232 domain-containing protein [Streptomyces sp. NPDC004111]|uniref:DUF4232 domain-containing protein n=1 Tax=Streptomyces sp. NPDC004111 TaxID=3364690 RepID=UPI0036765F90
MRAARGNKYGKICALGVVAAAALLTTTACQEGGGGTGGGAAGPPAASDVPGGGQSAPPSDAPGPGRPGVGSTGGSTGPSARTGTGGGSGSGGADGKGGDAGGESGTGTTGGVPADGRGTTACTHRDVRITSTMYPRDEVQHLLLTATNTGDKPCTLYAYPNVVLNTVARDVGPMESTPRATATIGPKQKGYAGLFLFRGGDPTDNVSAASIELVSADSSTPSGDGIDFPMPDGGFVNVGPNPAVTYWNLDRRAVEKFLFAK